jgi:hypothetical protein
MSYSQKRQLNLFEETGNKEMSWEEKYKAVLKSKRWERLKAKFMFLQSGKCLRCGWEKRAWDKTRTLDLHHKTYERLGFELDDDLELVCSVCHEKADQERALRGKIKSSNALYQARFSGWASKKYGDEFYLHEDDAMHDEFQDWVESRDCE